MDAGFLNFHKEEDFSSYFLASCTDDTHSIEDTNSNLGNGYQWDWDNDERELNGDVGLIPMSGNTDEFCILSSSPPSRDDFHKIVNDLHHFINIDITDVVADVADLGDVAADIPVDTDIISTSPPEELISPNGFDITKYVEQGDEPAQPRLGGKRIDMARRRYVIDESEEECDEHKSDNIIENKAIIKKEEDDEDDCTIDVETVTDPLVQPVLQAGDLNSLLEQFEATENTNMELQTHNLLEQDTFEEKPKFKVETPKKVKEEIEEYFSPKRIKEKKEGYSTPKRVKEEKFEICKMKIVSPIKTPTKKLVAQEKIVKQESEGFVTPAKDEVKNKQILDSLPQELIDRIRQSSKRKPIPVIPPIVPSKKRHTIQTLSQEINHEKIKDNKIVHLDHDYCSSTPRKDSGFSSCEEDDRSVLRSQPTVKNVDGKLMVSLLKTNTIKKKLNLEEYKKRLQTRSQNSSGSNSPAPEEDENARRLRHQEMLMKMAEEIITQQSNKEIKPEVIQKEVPITPIKPPSNMVMKTLVSVGTNTEESWGHLERVIQTSQLKFEPHSLLSSIVEHLPKVKPVITKQVEHGEDKTIVYLDKEMEKPKMLNKSVQTIYSSSNIRRRRTSSSTSTSSSDSYSSSSSRESSRSPSPVQKRFKDQMKEVEERRVIYVGRIADSMTKEDLKRRFNKFGPITNVSVHFRRKADNYGFVTFLRKEDAYEAVEKGNDDPNLPQYDLSFGGRRLFCQATWSDLDNVRDDAGYWSPVTGTVFTNDENSFDILLKQAQAKLKKRQL